MQIRWTLQILGAAVLILRASVEGHIRAVAERQEILCHRKNTSGLGTWPPLPSASIQGCANPDTVREVAVVVDRIIRLSFVTPLVGLDYHER